MPQFYDVLIYLRKRAGLTQQELADKTGLTRSSIGMYETGKREPDLETLEVFADFFNVDMNTLTGSTAFVVSPQISSPVQEITDMLSDMTPEELALVAARIRKIKESR